MAKIQLTKKLTQNYKTTNYDISIVYVRDCDRFFAEIAKNNDNTKIGFLPIAKNVKRENILFTSTNETDEYCSKTNVADFSFEEIIQESIIL